MGTSPAQFLQMIRRINVPDAAQTAIARTSTTFVELQREQLYQGVKADGEAIVPPYSSSTIGRKKKKGQPSDRVTLKDTGSFYSGINIEVSGDKVQIESSDSKDADLTKKYGKNVLGLGPDKRSEYVPILFPVLIDEIKKQMNG